MPDSTFGGDSRAAQDKGKGRIAPIASGLSSKKRQSFPFVCYGVLERIRTPNLRLRRPLLYPIELPARISPLQPQHEE